MNFKPFFLLLILVITQSCTLGKIDQQKGVDLTTQLLNDLKNENYTDIDKYYMNSFNASEPTTTKIEKFKRLSDVMGPIVSFEMLLAEVKKDPVSNVNQLFIKYKVVCTKVTALQSFILVNDEGQPKIIFQNIENL